MGALFVRKYIAKASPIDNNLSRSSYVNARFLFLLYPPVHPDCIDVCSKCARLLWPCLLLIRSFIKQVRADSPYN